MKRVSLERHRWGFMSSYVMFKKKSTPNTMDLLVYLMLFFARWFGVQSWAEKPVCLLHFLLSGVWWGSRKWKAWSGVCVRDCTRFVEVGNLSFTSLSACRASPCTLNNVPSVPATTANVIVFDTAKFSNGAFLSSSVSIPLHLLR